MGTKSSVSTSGSSRVDVIQVFRGLAASAVVVHHSATAVEIAGAAPSLIARLGLAQLGAAGVDLFFVISGFIMVYTSRFDQGTAPALNFISRRAKRIFPLYWLWTSVLLGLWICKLALTHHSYSPLFITGSYLLYPIFNGESFHPLLDQGWTLSFELLFYVVFALSIGFGVLRKRVPFVAACFMILAAIGMLLPSGGGAHYLLTDPMIVEFVLGMIAAEIFFSDFELSNAQGWAVAGLGALLFLASTAVAPLDKFRFLIWGGPAFLAVVGMTQVKGFRWNRGLIFLGDASYSIYLTHAIVLMAFEVAAKHRPLPRSIPSDVLVILLAVVTTALTSVGYLWIEKPLNQLLSKKKKTVLAMPAVSEA